MPDGESVPTGRRRINRGWLTTALVALFLLGGCFPSTIAVLAGFWILLAVAISVRAYWIAGLTLVLNPVSTSFLLGIGAYLSGAPHLQTMGLPGAGFGNIDPVTRCFRSTGGCNVTGEEWLTQEPHNLAVRGMVRMFGPPWRSYDGPYPDQSQSIATVSSGPVIPWKDFQGGAFPLEGEQVRFTPEAVKTMTRNVWYRLVRPGAPEPQVHAASYHGRCVVVRIQETASAWIGQDLDLIFLVDRNCGRPFATYELKGTRPSYRPLGYRP